MAGKPVQLKDLHFVSYRQKDGRRKWYVYAWRGGPKIMTGFGARKPFLTPDAVEAYREANEQRRATPRNTFKSLTVEYLKSPEFTGLADATKKNYRRWVWKAVDEFGDAPLRFFGDVRMRGEVMNYRDKFAESPRQSHYAIQVLSRILGWGMQRGLVSQNPAASVPSLYKANRADVLWTSEEIAAVEAEMAPHVQRAFRLAAFTGLALSDLVTLRWNEIGLDRIEHKRSKTGVKQIIPLFDEARAVLDEFPREAVTVVTNKFGKPYTPRGFSMAVERARKRAGVANGKHFHDLRGTFATMLMRRMFEDPVIDEILGWETGKSARIRRTYISRDALISAAIERFRENG